MKVSAEYAETHFADILSLASTGEEVEIAQPGRPTLKLVVSRAPGRLLSESLASARSRATTARIDAEFAEDVRSAIRAHPESLDPAAWE